jgi:hypothetical protein
MTVRAKYKCLSKKQTVDGNTIEMVPVTGGSKENESFFKWTPFGKLEMGTLNQAAADSFIVGQSYYIDFTPAESAPQQA